MTPLDLHEREFRRLAREAGWHVRAMRRPGYHLTTRAPLGRTFVYIGPHAWAEFFVIAAGTWQAAIAELKLRRPGS